EAQVPSGVEGQDRWLFTRTAGVVELYRWLPWVSREVSFERQAGDPFVTGTSPRVRVRIRSDRPVFVASSGDQIAGATQPSRDVTLFGADVRDFNLILSETYHVSTKIVAGVKVRVLTRPGGLPAATLHALARRALLSYNAHIGPYPWPTLTLAESAAGYGMESPALFCLPPHRTHALPYLVSHEIAHEWFYGLVGSDQVADPFADEAMADFLARDLIGTLRTSRCPFERADRSI